MASYEQLMEGARRADAAGDAPAAKRFLELAAEARKAAPQTPEAPAPVSDAPPSDARLEGRAEADTSMLGALARGIPRGISMGTLDELNAGNSAFGDWAAGKLGLGPETTIGDAYNSRLDYQRGIDDAVDAAHPMFSTGGDIVGGVAGALAGSRLLGLLGIGGKGAQAAAQAMPAASSASSALAKGLTDIVKGGATGAAQGAFYGFNSGEGGFDNRVGEAGRGAVLGGATGAAAPVIASGVRQAYLGVADLLSGGADMALGKASKARADRVIARTLGRAGQSADDVERALAAARADGQDVYNVADALGNAGQRRLAGIARAGGEGSQEIVDALNGRQMGQGDRIAADLNDAFGFRGVGGTASSDMAPVLAGPQRSAEAAAKAMDKARGKIAAVEYPAAVRGAGPVDVRATVDKINERLGQLEGSGVAGDAIDQMLAQYRARLVAKPSALKPGELSKELSDFERILGVKHDLFQTLEDTKKAGDRNKERILRGVYKELDKALENASSGYRAANDNFANSSRVIDAVDKGADMTLPRYRATDTIDDFKRMSPDQQKAARLGYGDSLLRQVEGGRFGQNKAAGLSKGKTGQEIDAFAVTPDRLKRQLQREETMFETRNRVYGNSRTADNQQDIADLKGTNLASVMEALTFNPGAIARLGAKGASAINGVGPGTRKLIADALLSGDVKALRAAEKRATTTKERQAIVEALIRLSGPRIGLPSQ